MSLRSKTIVHKIAALKVHLWPILFLLQLYRLLISPVLMAFGVRCRHVPSCSAYSKEAFIRHGLWRGSWLTMSRLSRCHPWGSHGFDPVPKTMQKRGGVLGVTVTGPGLKGMRSKFVLTARYHQKIRIPIRLLMFTRQNDFYDLRQQ